jgi:ABC-2 type transport system ATP-binding protein
MGLNYRKGVVKTMTNAIELKSLGKRFGTTWAVDHINLEIPKGILFGWLGPNGAGKTTTIKMMTGLLEPTEGTVAVAGVDVWKKPIAAKRKLAYVPDEPTMYGKLTGWEYLAFVASVYGMNSADLESRGQELLQNFGLLEAANNLTESYSHGMRQKMNIVAALLHQPEVLVMDEPTVGLDPRSARMLKDTLRQVCDQGTTVFLSTHILEIAEHMCDQVGIIDHGRLLAMGSVDQLRRKTGTAGESLEDIFLKLTGGEEDLDTLRALKNGEGA